MKRVTMTTRPEISGLHRATGLQQAFCEETAKRGSHTVAVQVINLGDQLGPKADTLFRSGSITLVFASQEVIDTIGASAAAGDLAGLESTSELLIFENRVITEQGSDDPRDMVRNASDLVTLNYASEEQHGGIVVARDRLSGCVSIPYDGGPIDDDSFSVNVASGSDVSKNLCFLLLKRPPRLTEVEQAASKFVPSAHSALNDFGMSPVGWFPLAVAVAARVAERVVVQLVVRALIGGIDDADRLSRSDSHKMLSELPSRPSSSELIQARRRQLLSTK